MGANEIGLGLPERTLVAIENWNAEANGYIRRYKAIFEVVSSGSAEMIVANRILVVARKGNLIATHLRLSKLNFGAILEQLCEARFPLQRRSVWHKFADQRARLEPWFTD